VPALICPSSAVRPTPERSMTSSIGRSWGASGVCERAEAYDDDASSALREAAASAWRDAPLKSVAVGVSRGTARIPPDVRRITKGARMPRMPKAFAQNMPVPYLAEL
jgi:hypothetical protein